MMKYLLITGIILFSTYSAAQVQVRKSFESKKDKEESAELNGLWPDDESSSFNLTGALGYTFKWGEYETSLTPSVQWNRNTLIEKEQNNLRMGLDYTTYLVKGDKLYHAVNASGKYNHDYESKVESFRLRTEWRPVFQQYPGNFFKYLIPFSMGRVGGGKGLIVEGNSIAGALEYQHNYQAEDEVNEGNITRLAYTYGVKLIPFSNSLKGKLYFSFNYQGWTELDNGSNLDLDEYIQNIYYSVNYIIAKKEEEGKDPSEIASISFGRVEGSDPWQGQEQQQFWKLTIKVKI